MKRSAWASRPRLRRANWRRCRRRRKIALCSLMADKLEAQSAFLIEENKKDLDVRPRTAEFRARCSIASRSNAGRVQAMAKGLRDVVALPDPVREVVKMWRRPNGLQVGRMRIPLGVIGIIYEARPNVTADAAALCLKSGNAVILRGGSEAHHSNQAIGAVLRQACAETRVPQDAVQMVASQRSRLRERAAAAGIIHRSHHSARRRGSHSRRGGEFENSRDQTLQRRLSRLRRRRCVVGDGGADLLQRQGAAARRCATRWKRCWCMKRSRRSSCRR